MAIDDPASFEDAVRAVWRSTVSPRAVTYAIETGADAAPLMAVVVQRFLGATRAGVMFTTFDGATLVEHVDGGSEKLVLGEVIPERLRIDRTTGVTEGASKGSTPGRSSAWRHSPPVSKTNSVGPRTWSGSSGATASTWSRPAR